MDRIGIRGKVLEFIGKYRYVLLVLLVGVVLMCLPDGDSAEQQESAAAVSAEGEDMETRLEEILSQIDGAGRVRVLLTEQSGESILYQTDEDITTGPDSASDRQDTVIITDDSRSEQGLVRQINPPVYQGAVVVCQGGDRASVRLAIVEAVSNATGLGADKITVLKMK